MNTQQMVNVLLAFDSGKKIQCRENGLSEWLDCNCAPSWNFRDYDYRIKPEPKTIWVCETYTGFHVFETEDMAKTRAKLSDCTKMRKYVEVE